MGEVMDILEASKAATDESLVGVFDVISEGLSRAFVFGICLQNSEEEAWNVVLQLVGSFSLNPVFYAEGVLKFSQKQWMHSAVHIFEIGKRFGLATHASFYNPLIDGFLAQNDPSSASVVLEKMIEDRVLPNEQSFLGFLKHFFQVKYLDGVRSLFERMTHCGVVVSEHSYVEALRLCYEKKEFALAQRLLEDASNHRMEFSVQSYRSLLTILCDVNVDEATLLYLNIVEKFPYADLSTAVMLSVLKNKNPLDALITFEQIIEKGATVDSRVFNEVLLLSSEHDYLYVASDLFEKMNSAQVSFSKDSIAAYIRCLCKHEKLEEALSVWKHYLSNGPYPDSETCETILRTLCNLDKSVEALLLLEEAAELAGFVPSTNYFNIVIKGLDSSFKTRKFIVDTLVLMERQGLSINEETRQSLTKVLKHWDLTSQVRKSIQAALLHQTT
eukprot:TRINITY_DN6487_c0_g1_i1.p1 TRINITY_DN6487_c0_g1~~TRINITY_DN6487_c0_g1_i1.p1  ORF type:complete len:497 (-),score=111.39 TRINITY_DN6487_c0_g1_i1:871-2202(-)